mmetsp:Transcript_34068/g.59406  ORF Transcript_34068/g.59406 Transcript_34068/m.59406 type:complete len:401 (-) Transcript_34068:1180-2382(-)
METLELDLTQDGGVLKTVLREGSGEVPAPGQEVEVHYTGKLENGLIFEQSEGRGPAFKFVLGQRKVIRGWDLGIATMKQGERALFVCRSEYAYGKKGFPPMIPPSSTLKFEIELISFKDYDPSTRELTLEERLAKANELKNQGNDLIRQGQFASALNDFYLQALTWIEADRSEGDAQHAVDLRATKAALYSNAAMCQLKSEAWESCIDYCNKALELQPSNVKVLFRKAQAQFNFKQLEPANQTCQAALALEPNSLEVKTLHAKIQKKIKSIQNKESKMIKAMFGQADFYEEKKITDYTFLSKPLRTNPQVYMDIRIADEEPRRLVFELFKDVVPITVENFRVFCTGERGGSVTYLGSIFHRIVKGFLMQGGDITAGDGSGGYSIYGARFEDENLLDAISP